MNEQELQEFVQWLPTSGIAEFDQKTPDEVVTILNGLSSEKDGEMIIKTLIDQYKKSKEETPETGMFKKGGKLVYLTELYKKGGKTKKCKCGCDLKRVMEKGGVVEKCACGCKTEKKAEGGTIKEPLVKKPLPKITKTPAKQVPDVSKERDSAKKFKSEFYSKEKGSKYDTESGLRIMKKGAELPKPKDKSLLPFPKGKPNAKNKGKLPSFINKNKK